MIQGFVYFHVHFWPRLTLIQYFQLVFDGRLQLILIFFIFFYIFPHVLQYSYISFINRKNTTVRNSPPKKLPLFTTPPHMHIPLQYLLHTHARVHTHIHVHTHTHTFTPLISSSLSLTWVPPTHPHRSHLLKDFQYSSAG